MLTKRAPKKRHLSFAALALAFGIASLAAQGTVAEAQLLRLPRVTIQTEVDGDSLTARISLPGGLGLDLTIAFEEVIGLSKSSLGLSARVLSLTDLLGILQQIPNGLQLPSGFPVLLTIEPPADGPLTFTGVMTIELHTHNLSFLSHVPLRLYAAPLGGEFRDITETVGAGSYRARGVKGGFSLFLVVLDIRPSAVVIDDKLSRLQSLLDDSEPLVDPEVFALLQELVDATAHAWSVEHDAGAALLLVEELERVVRENSGSAIPDVWRSSRDLVNVAGELRAAARTLRFSLALHNG